MLIETVKDGKITSKKCSKTASEMSALFEDYVCDKVSVFSTCAVNQMEEETTPAPTRFLAEAAPTGLYVYVEHSDDELIEINGVLDVDEPENVV